MYVRDITCSRSSSLFLPCTHIQTYIHTYSSTHGSLVPELEDAPRQDGQENRDAEEEAQKVKSPRRRMRRAREAHHLQALLDPQLLLLDEGVDHVRHRVHDGDRHENRKRKRLTDLRETKTQKKARGTGEPGGGGWAMSRSSRRSGVVSSLSSRGGA